MADNSSFKSEWYEILDKDFTFKNPIKHLKKSCIQKTKYNWNSFPLESFQHS